MPSLVLKPTIQTTEQAVLLGKQATIWDKSVLAALTVALAVFSPRAL